MTGERPCRPGGDTGSVSIEYVLLALFIAIAAAVAIATFGSAVLGLFTKEIKWDG